MCVDLWEGGRWSDVNACVRVMEMRVNVSDDSSGGVIDYVVVVVEGGGLVWIREQSIFLFSRARGGSYGRQRR